MKTLSTFLILGCLSLRLMAQNCYTNYNAIFIWGSNTPPGAVMTLYGGGHQVGSSATYPSTAIAFNISQMPNGVAPYIQGQSGTNVTHNMLFPVFDTNNFPLPAGVVTNPPTPIIWGDPTPVGFTVVTN